MTAADAKRWQKAFDAGDEEAFCHLFGPEEIPPHLGEFLGYFMVRKVIAGQEAAKKVFAGAADHQCCRILTAVGQSTDRHGERFWDSRWQHGPTALLAAQPVRV